jgi:phenylpropionate dioxygenase-like ring-hydroxylating dioxygenase large terminal subunit
VIAFYNQFRPFMSSPIESVLWNDWFPVARSQNLIAGSLISVTLFETDVVIWRAHSGALMAWADRCPHRSVKLSSGKVEGDTLVCSYHGMVYDCRGQCIKVPAHPNFLPSSAAIVQAYRVNEQYGLIFICLGNPQKSIAPFPEWKNSNLVTVLCGPYSIPCSGLRAIENFLDLSHLAIVHRGRLGVPDQASVSDYTVTTDEDGVHIEDASLWQPDPMGDGCGSTVHYNYWIISPLTAYLRKTTSTNHSLSILLWATPTSQESCLGWMLMSVHSSVSTDESALEAFQDAIVQQDIQVLANHSLKRLPLETQLEFHVQSDRGSIAYRKWLKTLGVSYGTM